MAAQEDRGADLARLLRHLELTVTRRLDGLLRGSFPSARPGPGTEPDAAREYVPGDDVRLMDWPATARTGVAQVRDPIAERELEAWLVADAPARLDAGAGELTKRHLLLDACAAVALLNDGPGDRTGLLAGTLVLPPAAGRRAARRLLAAVAEHRGGATLAADLAALRARAPRAGLVVVVSDFLGPLDWAAPLRVAAARAEVLAIRLTDPADEALPGAGPVTLADADDGRVLEVEVDERLRADYAAAALAHRAEVARVLRGAGARLVELRTDSDWVADLARQLARGRGAR
ncbi:DUF58 domain-containing protein [Corynebacterium sphenisci]|uniref:DUF58 domain-containing protein n=1 Tax=Corynebacterium sphenisci TaxID=191493 RepID=UPI0026DEA3B0|nr:DUF58 domain-containing protein [Corynebacterium sphenisci]MDO5729999.1 DUF58 domain-containing protein [Corynebacterium sphenisci]